MQIDTLDRPPLSRVILLAVAGCAMLPLSVGLSDVYDLVALAAGAIGLAFLLYALLMSVWYVLAVWTDIEERRADIASITPRRRELEAIRQLTPEQLAIVPRMDHIANIKEFMSKANGGWSVVECLSTPGGDVPLDFIREFLKYGGMLYLRPINSYSEGTLNYNHARAFTDWLRQQGLAIGGEGSRAGQAAQWVSDDCRAEAFNLFDVSMEIV